MAEWLDFVTCSLKNINEFINKLNHESLTLFLTRFHRDQTMALVKKFTLAHLLTLSSDSDLTEEVCGECAAEAAAAAPSFFIHMIKLRVAFGA